MKSSSAHRAGFTMLELMIVVGIIGLLTTLSMLSATTYYEKARTRECRLNQQALFNIVWNWRLDMQQQPGAQVNIAQLIPAYIDKAGRYKCPACGLPYGPVFTVGVEPICPGISNRVDCAKHIWKQSDKLSIY